MPDGYRHRSLKSSDYFMDIQPFIQFDQELLLKMNGSNSLFWDGFMWLATNMLTWMPFAAILLYVIIKNNKIKEAFWVIGMLALVILLADQISSGICKPYFARFRPTQDPLLMYQIDIVNGYRGGIYGFTSSHAANTFGVAVFLSLVIRSWSLSTILFIWARAGRRVRYCRAGCCRHLCRTRSFRQEGIRLRSCLLLCSPFFGAGEGRPCLFRESSYHSRC